MGRIDKIKREMIMEANKRLLNEIADIKVLEPEMTDTTTYSDRGLKLKCIKIDYKDPKNSEIGEAGPYPWNLVRVNKEVRPVRLYVYREGKPRDVVWGGEGDYEMVIGFEEISDPFLKSLFKLQKKYIMTTTQSPGLTGEQFCKVVGPMDKGWDDNLFGINQNVIEPYPDFSFITD
jgi:hypothetical protein